MITGVYPDTHKVTGNLELHPGRTSDLPWKWDYKYNACKQDIFTEAKKAGYETAAVFWPVTGNHPAIDHLIDCLLYTSPVYGDEEGTGEEDSDHRFCKCEKNWSDCHHSPRR